MKTQTHIKAGGSWNHNQTLVRKVEGIWLNHNQTLIRKVEGRSLNHNQTLVRKAS